MAAPAGLPCSRGHELVGTTLGDLRRSSQGYLYAPGFQCDRCHETFTQDGMYTAHCATCEYDICAGCSAQMCTSLECDRGHMLSARYSGDLVAENRAYSTGYRCDTCGGSNGYPVRHCSTCSFDMCPRCVQARLGYPVTHPLGPTTGPRPGPQPVPLPGAPPFIPHLAGSIAPMPHAAPDFGLVSAEWRSVLNRAGINQMALRQESVRQGVLDVVGRMYPGPSRVLTELPPLASIPLDRRDVTARLRAWFRQHEYTDNVSGGPAPCLLR